MENMPLVSVIMPTYNGEKYVEESISSVLKQNYPNMELLILDDGSEDHTQEILKFIKQQSDTKDQIRLMFDQNNKGIPRNMNIGIKEAMGKYIAVLDQDDIWLDENKISKQIDFLENNNDYGIIGTNAIIDRMGKTIKSNFPQTDEKIRNSILGMCPFLHSSVVYNRAIALDIGGYSEDHKYTLDYKFFLDIIRESKAFNINEFSTYYRIHGDNVSMKNCKEQRKQSLGVSIDYMHDFPNSKKAIIFKTGNLLLANLIGGTPFFEKIKLSIKNIYQ